MVFDLRYLGHSAFEVYHRGEYILIDPFLDSFPQYDWQSKNIKEIFVTHGHSDHLGSAIEIAKAKEARINTVFELANYCADRGALINPVNLGGCVDYGWCRAVFIPALHSSSTPDGNYAGCAASIMFDISGVKLFHAGDTCLSSDFKLIKELSKPDIALLPIGGTYTMDLNAAVIATRWLGAEVVIPMHYNTYPQINADVNKFKILIENIGKHCTIMNIGDVEHF